MTRKSKKLCNPSSTGGSGYVFETQVQASFVVLMLVNGFVPCLTECVIKKIILQAKRLGYDTDDLIIFANNESGKEKKILCQVKQTINITKGDKLFGEVIQAAWNDFNNPKIFTNGNDAITLITNHLAKVDANDTRTILEWARATENAEVFIEKVEMVGFSSNKKRAKLEVFREQIKKANDDREISDEELFQFLRHFHLLAYDFAINSGATLSLIHSLIRRYSKIYVPALWAQIVGSVQYRNKNAGTITKDLLPDEITKHFVETTAKDFLRTLRDWSQSEFASELAIANLIGSWSDGNEKDKEVIEEIANIKFTAWILGLQKIVQHEEPPLIIKNGIWSINNRFDLWNSIGSMIFYNHLVKFKQGAIKVLRERDPQFDLPSNERYAASIHGKVLKYSSQLRKGLAESLALLGCYPDALKHTPLGKPEEIVVLTIREIFHNADWVLWGSLNDLLPFFAEASPGEFLKIVEDALLGQSSCPFIGLFAQEEGSTFGRNYLTGLLWAMESLAWSEEYLARVATILGELALIDPGGNSSNRPLNSLITIFLPWLPQTTASSEKRLSAIKTLCKEVPDIAWTLLINLLPNRHRISHESYRPIWRKFITESWKKEVTQEEYWKQVSCYTEITLDLAKNDIKKLSNIIGCLDNLPKNSFENLINMLSSEDIMKKSEQEKLMLWDSLEKLISKNKRHVNQDWALDCDLISRLEDVLKKFAPRNPLDLNRSLFENNDYDSYEGEGDWEEQGKRLNKLRQQAVSDILEFGGIDDVIDFSKMVECSWKVGLSLGSIAAAELDSVILPSLLITKNKNIEQLVKGFVVGRYQNQKWEWADKVCLKSWTTTQIGKFLVNLPFAMEAWNRSKKLLGDDEKEYWGYVSVFPDNCELKIAIENLIKFGRPDAAIYCIYYQLHNKQKIDNELTIRALLTEPSSFENSKLVSAYEIVEIIKFLQVDDSVNKEDLVHVEWRYLYFLENEDNVSPKLLENKLAADPKFFCEIVSLAFRSKKDINLEVESTEQQKEMAKNAYHLLDNWRAPPGAQLLSDSFDEDHFVQWLQDVKAVSAKSGHLNVALTQIGKVLFYAPSDDKSGFWINASVADALNDKNAQKIRDGFCLAIYNSRGAHWVDPTGKPEKELAVKYKKQAEEAELAGYQRLAVSLQSIANSYEKEVISIQEKNQER